MEEFCREHPEQAPPCAEIIDKWVHEKEVDDFIESNTGSGIIIGDILADESLRTEFSPELQQAFADLMGEKADTVEEIRELLMEKIQISPESVRGMMNKIQGQLGENLFAENTGSAAQLAESGKQEAWDVAVANDDSYQYVQVKVYDDAESVMEKLREINESVEQGGIYGVDGAIVEQVDLAVNADIYEEVALQMKEEGMSNTLFSLEASREEIRQHAVEGFEHAAGMGMESFFEKLIGGALTAGAIHAAVNGFLLWKGAKDQQQALEDTVYSTALTSGGIFTGMTVEAVFLENALWVIGGPVGFGIKLGSALLARSFLKRFANRRYLVKRLEQGNLHLRDYIQQHE